MRLPWIVGLVIFAVILAGAFVGRIAREHLPDHHLSDDTEKLVSVSMAVVGSIAALVLGLLLSTANASFNARSAEVTALSADILRLDQMLRLYGPEAAPARGKLRQYAERKTHDLFPDDSRDLKIDNPSTYEVLHQVEELMLELAPTDPRRQWFLQQSTLIASRIDNSHWQLAQINGHRTPIAFISLVVFWLAVLFSSFGLFAPNNHVSGFALILCAMSVSGAVYMILEFDQPFGGLIQISSGPMTRAVSYLSTGDFLGVAGR